MEEVMYLIETVKNSAFNAVTNKIEIILAVIAIIILITLILIISKKIINKNRKNKNRNIKVR